jgi:rubrerythrin
MIKGKAKMEFGTGDIRMTGVLSEGVGALCCITQEPHQIGEKVPVEDTWSANEAEVILTFTKTESIDVLISELKDVKAMMDGSYDFETERSAEPVDLDLDAFLNDCSLEETKSLLREYNQKEIPKKPTFDGDGYAPDGTEVWDEWICPNCGSVYEVDYDEYDYCPNCGQRIDWAKVDESEL